VFLGDYFDDFDDNIFEVTAMAKWLVENIDNPNYTFLCGNHDFHYMVPRGKLYCSGFATWKYETIEQIVHKETWDKLRFFYNIDDIWFSHAGITNYWFEHPVLGLNVNVINETIQDAIKSLHSDPSKLGCLWAADRYRGGMHKKGGILWNDWRNSDFIPNTLQIVGHTPNNNIEFKEKKEINSSLINVDTHLNEIMILDTDTKNYKIVQV